MEIVVHGADIGVEHQIENSGGHGHGDRHGQGKHMDGAPLSRQVISIYIPMTSPTLFYLLCTNLASSMMMSDLVIALTQGGTSRIYPCEGDTGGGSGADSGRKGCPRYIVGFPVDTIFAVIDAFVRKQDLQKRNTAPVRTERMTDSCRHRIPHPRPVPTAFHAAGSARHIIFRGIREN